MEIYIDRNVGKLYLSKEKVLELFGMQNSKLMNTSLAAHFNVLPVLVPQCEDEQFMSRVPYSSVVENIMYAMVCTCP